MLPAKRSFSTDVCCAVRDTCKLAFNLQNDNDLLRIFGMTGAQLEEIIAKIIDSLPDTIFQHNYPPELEEIECICAREFIFFQVQERLDDPRYQQDLNAFIHVFKRDIEKRMNGQMNMQSTMREEK
jgi:hypothetical protein